MAAAAGLALIGLQGGHSMTTAGFLLTLCAAASWALGNIVTKRLGKVDLVGLVVWASLIPPLPFFALSYALEGPQRIATAFSAINASSVFAVVYLAFVATLLGYSLGVVLSRAIRQARLLRFRCLCRSSVSLRRRCFLANSWAPRSSRARHS